VSEAISVGTRLRPAPVVNVGGKPAVRRRHNQAPKKNGDQHVTTTTGDNGLGTRPDIIDAHDIDWIEFTAGNFVKPVRFSQNGEYVLLGRMTQGAFEPRHRHIGDVMVYVISGAGADVNGNSIAEGSWFYERDGAVHSAFVCKDDTITLTIGKGNRFEVLDEDDQVLATVDPLDLFKALPDEVRRLVERD
jgi:anti-sigma factor ChrR (cupin superfamily)